MSTHIFPQSAQAAGNFNNGAILENKPIGFPGEGGVLKPYSNLFYWAHAWTPGEASTIGLHPHQGFEIMSFVLRGEIEHYDTGMKEWRKLKEGDMQIIRAGNGISHSEKITADSAIFQIWTDPNLRVTLSQPASYNDYPSKDFPLTEAEGMVKKTYFGEGSPLTMDTPLLEIAEYQFAKGKHHFELSEEIVLSAYLIAGELLVDGQKVEANDFIQVQLEEGFDFEAITPSKLFVIASPQTLDYPTYAAMRR